MELDLPPKTFQWTCRRNSSAGQAHLDGSHPQNLCDRARARSGHHHAGRGEDAFDRSRDQPEVAWLLSAGCAHMRKAFDIEDINLDELIATAMDDPQAMTSESKAFAASILPICKRPTVSFARMRRCRCPLCISARSLTTTTRRSATCPITTSSRASSCRVPASCSTARANASRRCSRRTSGGNGSRSATFRNTSRRRSSRPRGEIADQRAGVRQRGLARLCAAAARRYFSRLRTT